MGNDLAIYASGNGGEATLSGNDLVTTDSLFNMVFLALFGGNPGFVTTGNELKNEQRGDWHGNALLMPNDPAIQFNSTLEHTLNTTPLTSEGRLLIENSAIIDLAFFSTFAKVKVEVSIVKNDRVSIFVKLTELDNLDDKEFQFIWDATKQELIDEIII
jgi:hypothetical protein